MTEETFKRVGQGFANARNLVSGIINAKDSYKPELARELTFIAYQIMDSTATPEQQVLQLKSLGFTIPWAAVNPVLDFAQLEQIYLTRKAQAPYMMDGLVIYQNQCNAYPTEGLPKHIIAFKMMGETAEVIVTQVIWKASKDRLLKPVVHYQSIFLSGAHLERATAHNARYVVLNKIGPGAKIFITRSGDTIPYVVSVLEPAAEPSLPDPQEHGEYTWNENQVEFVLKQDNAQVLAAKIEHFLDKLEIKNVGPLRVKAFVDSGLISIYHVLTATPDRLAQIERIGPVLANQIYQEIQTKINGVSLARIMGACGVFPGIGERRFTSIIQAYPNFLSMARESPQVLVERIQQVKGFKKLAAEIAIRMSTFADWLDQHPMIRVGTPNAPPAQATGTLLTIVGQAPQIAQTLTGMTIVFSGFRDKELEGAIEARGGRVTTSVSRNTSMLIMKDVNDRKGKANKALAKGIPLVAREVFIAQYIR
jgi:DNA ligase (NAD+)